MCDDWRDFWRFVEGVGGRPSPKHKLCRLRDDLAMGPDNFYWATPQQISIKAVGSAAYQRESRRINPWRGKSNDLRKQYGIDLSDYVALLERQNNRCAICRATRDANFALAVDHCHATKKVRGLLCSNCNRGLGHYKDDPELLERAAQYLRAARGELPFT